VRIKIPRLLIRMAERRLEKISVSIRILQSDDDGILDLLILKRPRNPALLALKVLLRLHASSRTSTPFLILRECPALILHSIRMPRKEIFGV
jgi:hypothetical protein